MDRISCDRPLRGDHMRQIMTAIMAGAYPEQDLRLFLTALAARGETAEEIATAVQVLREHAVRLPLTRADALCDTCGTGGDGQHTINVSTLAALVAAAAGVRMVKHGNRSASSRCGSADLMEALDVNLQATPAQVARCIDEAGFGFCFAPAFHPAMKAVAAVRKALGIRTIFNLIGPLANPAPLAYQLVGVPDLRLMQPMAEALLRLGIRHGMVVRGADGLDEITTTGPTDVVEVREGRITRGQLDPAAYGIPLARIEDLRGGDVARNTAIARQILNGQPSPARDLIVLNAGCAIYVAGRCANLQEGVRLAGEALSSGRATRLLEQVKELSQHVG